MVSYFNQLHAEGMDITQVILEGAKRRLRPVLMTANITAYSLLPVLFAHGPGSEIQKPLAIVVIGRTDQLHHADTVPVANPVPPLRP